jgi:hypothetical protein
MSSDSEEEKKESAGDLISNLEIINRQGKKASKIIDELQEHARLGTVQQFFEEEKK